MFVIFVICICILSISSISTIMYMRSIDEHDTQISTDNYRPDNEYILPKNIYCYWDNFKDNKLIQAHINTWKRKLNWNIIVIDKDNIRDYVDDKFLKRYGKLNPTRFSDFLRYYLLLKNGGVWFDASIIVTNGNFLDKYRDEMMKYHYDVCLYEFPSRTTDPNTPYLESWFLMAPKNSKFLIDLFNEFDRSFIMGFLNYKIKILIPSKIDLSPTIGYLTGTYLMNGAVINYIMHVNKNKYKINIKNASESMFKIHDDNKWDNKSIVDFILNNNDWSNYYAIKLIGGIRDAISSDKIDDFIIKLNKL